LSPLSYLFLILFFLVGTFSLTALSSSMRSMQQKGWEKISPSSNRSFIYRRFHHFFFPTYEFETLFFATTIAQNLTRYLFAAASLLILYNTSLQAYQLIGAIVIFILSLFFFGDYLPRILGTQFPQGTLQRTAPFASFFLFLIFPVTFLLVKLTKGFSRTVYFDSLLKPDVQAKQEIIEIIQKAQLTEQLDANEKKLISSLLSFCEHLTKEVMIPRVDVFSLDSNTSIKEALIDLENEGYSRVPVYEDNVDNIKGILMYKDLLTTFIEYLDKNHDSKILEAPISTIMKSPLYTPETKRISDLLQEFRKKKVHIAIVVDEYGGTEGIITIEDILEDIVGEIADEYDTEEELYTPLSDGSWVVDPRMSILDAEDQLGISIPQEGDYDTIGGYIYHCSGEIPSKGFTVQCDEFELTVLKSNDRTIEKVRIIATDEDEPTNQENQDSNSSS